MQKHLSVLKRARQNKTRKSRNTQVKKLIKTVIKNVNEKIELGNAEEANKSLTAAMSVIDKAASKGILHKKSSSRKIARLSSKVSSLKNKSKK
ncbi:MAG TPA: 30S ribosomal protein S20 [Nitrospinota bacterium]|nr:30S ribosomal protein S20 [Nitrospinota bacterium]